MPDRSHLGGCAPERVGIDGRFPGAKPGKSSPISCPILGFTSLEFPQPCANFGMSFPGHGLTPWHCENPQIVTQDGKSGKWPPWWCSGDARMGIHGDDFPIAKPQPGPPISSGRYRDARCWLQLQPALCQSPGPHPATPKGCSGDGFLLPFPSPGGTTAAWGGWIGKPRPPC